MQTAANQQNNSTHLLSDQVDDLRKTVDIKEQQLEKKERQIEQLLDYIQLLRQKQFGRSSEKISKDQINLFDESELEKLLGDLEEQDPEENKPDLDTPSQVHTEKKKPVRRPLPKNLKRIEKIIDISDADKVQMKDNWILIGYDTSEQLAVIP